MAVLGPNRCAAAERLEGPLTAEQARDLWEVLDNRYGQGATVVTSQVPVAPWHALMPDGTTAEVILDRMVHHAPRR